MDIPVKLMVTGALGCAIAGGFVERQFSKNEVVKTQVDTQEHIVSSIVTKKHEVDNPNGTKVIDSTTTDNSDQTTKIIQTIVDSKAAQQFNWLVSASAGVNANLVKTYAVSVDRRLLGPTTLGVYVTTGSELGVRLGFMF